MVRGIAEGDAVGSIEVAVDVTGVAGAHAETMNKNRSIRLLNKGEGLKGDISDSFPLDSLHVGKEQNGTPLIVLM